MSGGLALRAGDHRVAHGARVTSAVVALPPRSRVCSAELAVTLDVLYRAFVYLAPIVDALR